MTDETIQRLRQAIDAPDLSGTRYTLVAQIGQGGMGSVWSAHDRELDRTVAIKVLPVWDAAFSELLLREARILAGLEHPGMVPVHDAGTLADGRVFYAMKLVQGCSLSNLTESGSRWPGKALSVLRLFQRVCEPVAFAHSRGVIHRDLKPENIMVGEFGEVLVMDWGVAKLRDSALAEGVIGTREYMSPEQARGDNDHVDARSDIYALGGILRFLLPGGHGTPKAMRAICAKALAENPAERYASVAELAADVGRFLDGDPVTAYRENILEIALRFIGRHRALVLLVLAYLVMRALLLLLLGR